MREERLKPFAGRRRVSHLPLRFAEHAVLTRILDPTWREDAIATNWLSTSGLRSSGPRQIHEGFSTVCQELYSQENNRVFNKPMVRFVQAFCRLL